MEKAPQQQTPGKNSPRGLGPGGPNPEPQLPASCLFPFPSQCRASGGAAAGVSLRSPILPSGDSTGCRLSSAAHHPLRDRAHPLRDRPADPARPGDGGQARARGGAAFGAGLATALPDLPAARRAALRPRPPSGPAPPRPPNPRAALRPRPALAPESRGAYAGRAVRGGFCGVRSALSLRGGLGGFLKRP